MKYILALDVGTSSTRAVIYADDGTVHFSHGFEYHSEYPQPLHVEQNPASWTEAADAVLSAAAGFMRHNGVSIEGIAVTSQRSSLIPVDSRGRYLRRAIMWQDKRNIDTCRELVDRHGLEYFHRKTGLRVNPLFILTKLVWLKKNQPDIFNGASRFVGVQDYVVHYLTGSYKTDWTQGSRTMLMDLARFQWDPELLAMAGVGEERLCELVAPGSVAGELTPVVAAATGLPAGIPVVVAGGDQQCAALALGVIRPGVAEANTGTGSFVLAFSDQPVFEPECRVLCQASAWAGKWMLEAGIFNTGAIYRWFKERFCPELREREDAYHLMNKEAAKAPAGANGVVMLPHFEGSMAPNWNPAAKGIFFNLGLGTTRGEMLRAIQDGIAMEIRENLQLIQSVSHDIDEVSVAGGMCRSDVFCRIQASAYNKRVIRYDNPEASSLGACMVAAPALGLYDSLDQAFERMHSNISVSMEPDPEEVMSYDKLAVRRKLLYDGLCSTGVYEAFI